MSGSFVGGRGGARGGKKGGRKGKKGPVEFIPRDAPVGQAAFFGPAPTDGMALGGDGEDHHLMDDDCLEMDSERSPNSTRRFFDPMEARELMDERWHECMAHERLEVVPPSNAKVNAKFNISKEMAKVVQRFKQTHGSGEALE